MSAGANWDMCEYIVMQRWVSSRVRQWLVEDDCQVNLHYYFEPLYPKLVKNNPTPDLVSTIWRPGPSKVR